MPTRAGDRIREEYTDALEYADTGCEISSKCVECPLPICRYDDSNWYTRHKKLALNPGVLNDLLRPFKFYKVIAEKHGCNAETVRRLHEQLTSNKIDLKTIKIIQIHLKEK